MAHRAPRGVKRMISAVACMALALYFEARGEPAIGQIAVGHVILNRTMDKRFPKNVCEVVFQGQTYKWKPDLPIRHRCQFSFYCDGKSDKPGNHTAHVEAVYLSKMILDSRLPDPTEGSTHYHSVAVLPSWASSKTAVVRINNHIFYRWEK